MPAPSEMGSSYSRSVEIVTRAKEIFHALTHDLEGWWGSMDVPITSMGDRFTVSWGEPWYRFEVIRYEPPLKLSWHCIDANQIINGLDDVQKEWVGTQLHWTIEAINSEACLLTVVHQGLVPEFTCYEFCVASWDQFLGERLKAYLEN